MALAPLAIMDGYTTPPQSPRLDMTPPAAPLAPVRESTVARPRPGFTVYQFLQNPTHPPAAGPNAM